MIERFATFKITYHMAKSKRMRLSDMIIHLSVPFQFLFLDSLFLIKTVLPRLPFRKTAPRQL